MLLCMYGSGSINFDTCRIAELVAAADMYAVTSVKDVASYEIKMDYCHFFHKVKTCIIVVTVVVSHSFHRQKLCH